MMKRIRHRSRRDRSSFISANSVRGRPSSCRGGFTLFEILISIAVVGLIMGLVVGGMNQFLELDMKKASNKMAATMRYLTNKAALEGLYIRLVIDMEEQTYHVEATTDPVLITRGEEGPLSAVTPSDEDEPTGEAEEDAGPPKLKPREVTFSPMDSYLLKPTKLPSGIFFKDVSVEHRRVPVEGGKASIFFFPNGYMEHAVINLRDEDDELNYSLETNPIGGRVNIDNTYRTLEER